MVVFCVIAQLVFWTPFRQSLVVPRYDMSIIDYKGTVCYLIDRRVPVVVVAVLLVLRSRPRRGLRLQTLVLRLQAGVFLFELSENVVAGIQLSSRFLFI